MASAPPQPIPTRTLDKRDEIRIVSHSNLFYWWPIWALALLMGVLTMLDGHMAAVVPTAGKQDNRPEVLPIKFEDKNQKVDAEVVVPGQTEPVAAAEIKGKVGDKNVEFQKRDVLVLPENAKLAGGSKPEGLHLHMASKKGYGVLFCIILLLVIVITNVPLRGMWSVVVIITIIMLSIIFHLAGFWETILLYLSFLDVRINAAGYFVIGGTLLAIWLFTTLLFDQQIYMLFTPGQLKVCTEIGGGEQVYDAMGMTVEKQRSDLFRHWILGLGSGDLIVKTSGAQAHHFDLPNVLFVGRKIAQIEDLLKKKAVVDTR